VPAEFACKPRSLKELDRFKAVELRQFLLYTGPVVLRKHLCREKYEHFMCLCTAVILLSTKTNAASTDYARRLLVLFVQNSRVLYGDAFVVYNVHCLIHLADDVRNHERTLDHLSAFPFENHLRLLKQSVKSPVNPVYQIARRLSVISRKTKNAFQTARQFSTARRDNCYLLQNGDTGFVEQVAGNAITLRVLSCSQLRLWFAQPCESANFNILAIAKCSYRKTACKRQHVHAGDIVE
jgi:hypothetical protein